MATFNFNHMFFLNDSILQVSNASEYSGSFLKAKYILKYSLERFWRSYSWGLHLIFELWFKSQKSLKGYFILVIHFQGNACSQIWDDSYFWDARNREKKVLVWKFFSFLTRMYWWIWTHLNLRGALHIRLGELLNKGFHWRKHKCGKGIKLRLALNVSFSASLQGSARCHYFACSHVSISCCKHSNWKF